MITCGPEGNTLGCEGSTLSFTDKRRSVTEVGLEEDDRVDSKADPGRDPPIRTGLHTFGFDVHRVHLGGVNPHTCLIVEVINMIS